MTEALHRSSDVPNYDTYPAELPPASAVTQPPKRGALEQRAIEIGAIAGKAVAVVRKGQARLKTLAGQTEETINTLAENAKLKAKELKQAAASKAAEVRSATQEKASELGARAKDSYYRARLKANQVSRDYPLQIILVAGVVGFLVGATLRIWRSNRESF